MSEDCRNEESQGKHGENTSQFRSFPNLQIIKSEGGTSNLFNAHLLLLHHKSKKQGDKEDGNDEDEEGVVH